MTDLKQNNQEPMENEEVVHEQNVENKKSEENLTDAWKELASQLEKAAKMIGEQLDTAAKKIDDHLSSEQFQQRTESVKKASNDIADKLADSVAKGTVLVSEGISIFTDTLQKGLKKTMDAIQDAFDGDESDEADESQSAEEETAGSEEEAYSIDIEWKEPENDTKDKAEE